MIRDFSSFFFVEGGWLKPPRNRWIGYLHLFDILYNNVEEIFWKLDREWKLENNFSFSNRVVNIYITVRV